MLGYKWNYYLSNDIQRNILRNILEIYKRKGTKFSFHHNLYQLNPSISLYEPYKDIFTLNKSGLNRNSDIDILWNKQIDNIEYIDVDSDGFVYVLIKNTCIIKYDKKGNIVWTINNTDIIDMCISYNGFQKDILYFLTNKNEVYYIKLFNSSSSDFKLLLNEEQLVNNCEQIDTDLEGNVILKTNSSILLYLIDIDDNDNLYSTVNKTVIDLSNTYNNLKINDFILDNDDNIILCHKGTEIDTLKISYSFLKKYSRYTENYYIFTNNNINFFTKIKEETKENEKIKIFYLDSNGNILEYKDSSGNNIYGKIILDGYKFKLIIDNQPEIYYTYNEIFIDIKYELSESGCFAYSIKDELHSTFFNYEINKIQFNQSKVFCLINNNYVYTFSNGIFSLFKGSDIYSELLIHNNNDTNNYIIVKADTYDSLINIKKEVDKSSDIIYFVLENEKYYNYIDDDWEEVYLVKISDESLIKDYDVIYYLTTNSKYYVYNTSDSKWEEKKYNVINIEKYVNLIDLVYKIGNDYYNYLNNKWVKLDTKSELKVNIYIEDIEYVNYLLDSKYILNVKYYVNNSNCYYLYNNNGFILYNFYDKNNLNGITLTDEEYPDYSLLEISIKNKIETIDKKGVKSYTYDDIYNYSFDKDTKTIILNDQIDDDDNYIINLKEYESNNIYYYKQEIDKYIRYKDNTNWFFTEKDRKGVYRNYYYNEINNFRIVLNKKTSPVVLTYNTDYVIDYDYKYIYIRKKLFYGNTLSFEYYSENTWNVIEEIEYKKTNILEVSDEIKSKFLNNVIVITKTEFDELDTSEIKENDLYKIENTSEYYRYTSDGFIREDYVIHYYDTIKNTDTIFTIVDKTSTIESGDSFTTVYKDYKGNIINQYILYRYGKLYFIDSDGEFYITDTVKIKNLSNFTDFKTIENITKNYLIHNIRLTKKERPYELSENINFNFDIYCNNNLIDNFLSLKSFDNSNNIIEFNDIIYFKNSNDYKELEETDIIKIIFYSNKLNIYSLGIDMSNSMSDYIAIGFDKSLRIYNQNAIEMYSINTLLPVNNILSRLDSKYILYSKNDNILTYSYCNIENGGILTSKDYYSNGILVIKVDNIQPELFQLTEMVRPAGWKLVLEGYRSLFYNLNSKTYKNKDYQEKVVTDEEDTSGYPSDIKEYEYLDAKLIDEEITYETDSDKQRRNYLYQYYEYDPNNTKVTTNLLSDLDEQTRYYREQYIDSIQYRDPNNGAINPICMLGKTFIVHDELRNQKQLYIYESMFDDVVLNEEDKEYTDYLTQFRNSIHYANQVEFKREEEVIGGEIEVDVIEDMLDNGLTVTIVGGGAGSSDIYETSTDKYISLGGSGADYKYNIHIDIEEEDVGKKLILHAGKGGSLSENGENSYIKYKDTTTYLLEVQGGKTSTITNTTFNVGDETGKGKKAANIYKLTDSILDIDNLIYVFDSVDSEISLGNHIIFYKELMDDNTYKYIYTTAGGASYGNSNGWNGYFDNYGAGGCYNVNNGTGSNGYIKIEW